MMMHTKQIMSNRKIAPPRMKEAACSGGKFIARADRLLSIRKYTMFKTLPIHQPKMYC